MTCTCSPVSGPAFDCPEHGADSLERLSYAELRAKVAALEAEVERLTMTDESQRGALTLVLTEHRVWVEALEAALDQADAIEPHGSDEWVTSGESMRATVLRVIRDAVARVDAPTIEARVREAEAEVERLRGVAEYSASQCESLAGRLRLAWDRLDAVRALADEWEREFGEGTEAWRVFGPQTVSVPFAVKSIRRALGSDATASEPTVERITDDNGDELERGADSDATHQPQPTSEATRVQAWRDGCQCRGGPHGGFTCDRCSGRQQGVDRTDTPGGQR